MPDPAVQDARLRRPGLAERGRRAGRDRASARGGEEGHIPDRQAAEHGGGREARTAGQERD